ncbi:MAG: AAA family ATPase [Bacteroidales bacterium]|nr:AAA family ATPase [Bacteroidales bacterium]
MATLSNKQTIDAKYEVLFFIEENDGAEIYRVKDLEGKIQRLKLYSSKILDQERFSKDNQLHEILILSEVNHDAIIKMQDHGELILNNEKYYYLVTNFISGERFLDKVSREGPLNPFEVIPVMVQLLEAVDYLHSLHDPVIHNDITPENVWLDYSHKDENAILTNFSSAVHFSQANRSFSPKLLTPFYMAEEQFNGLTLLQSDLFSAGALMYFLCFGFPPWFIEVKSTEELIPRLQNERKKHLTFQSDHLNAFDDHLLNIMRKALAPDINHRFRNAGEFLKALRREVIVDNATSFASSARTGKTAVKKTGNGFKDIAGMQELKDILTHDVINVLKDKQKYEEYGLTIPNGMLLYGPPGCGKTFISEKFAEEIDFNFISVKPSDLASIYVHGSQEKIGKLFEEARTNAPSIIFFDEMDALIPNRKGDLSHSYASEVNEFLSQMSDCSKYDVFIIAATNRPERMDPAVLRSGRIDKKVYVGPPDLQAREELFRIYLTKRPAELSMDYAELARLTENYVASDIKLIIDESSRIALKTNARISLAMLKQVIQATRPSVTKEEINFFEKLKQSIEKPDEDKPQDRRPIGFRKD